MSFLDLAQLILAIVALLGVFVQWRNGRTARQTGDASAAKDISEAYKTLIEPLEKRIKELEERLSVSDAKATRLEKELDLMKAREEEHMAGIRVLISQIVSIGERPLWKPKDSLG